MLISQKHSLYILIQFYLSIMKNLILMMTCWQKAFESRIINGKYVVMNAIEISQDAAYLIMKNIKKFR